jgi:uncharacterized protein
MIHRQLNIPKIDSFFLFGARGSGKTSLLKKEFPEALFIDLLDQRTEQNLSLNPESFFAMVHAHVAISTAPIVIDEVQRLPWLLNEVHRYMESGFKPVQFVLTGSSARKLKSGGANLLAGRAVVRNLFPFTATELHDSFNLQECLQWGTLPKVWCTHSPERKNDFLEAYALTYLKEEVWAEHLVRKLEPFRRFLEVAAQQNGKVVNYSSIAKDVGANSKTVQSYFEILEDTLLGFHLDAFHFSLRKRLKTAPKFYLFDTGVVRALARHLSIPVVSQTSYYGELFESFVMNEVFRKIQYEKLAYKMCYLQTAGGVEVDLVLDRPGKPIALIEIKSAQNVRPDHVAQLNTISKLFPKADVYCFSLDNTAKKYDSVLVVHWQEGLKII